MNQFLNWANKNGIPIPENTAVNDITKLTISNPHITELPESLSELSKLCELEISSCDRLTLIGDIIEQLPSLFSFTVWNCPSLLKLSDKISNLKKLQFCAFEPVMQLSFSQKAFLI
jgi:Leucine-rich repeat (LRR) protein